MSESRMRKHGLIRDIRTELECINKRMARELLISDEIREKLQRGENIGESKT